MHYHLKLVISVFMISVVHIMGFLLILTSTNFVCDDQFPPVYSRNMTSVIQDIGTG